LALHVGIVTCLRSIEVSYGRVSHAEGLMFGVPTSLIWMARRCFLGGDGLEPDKGV
jgi:hypothetical protein